MLNKEQLQELRSLQEQGYIRSNRHAELPLTIYNYTTKTQYEGYWTELTRMCRGLVLDDNGKIIIKCVPKFFNQNEPLASPIDLTNARISEKLDGYYIAIKLDDDYGLLVTSRGSFSSKYALTAKEFITTDVLFKMSTGYTYFCELCQNFAGDEAIIATQHPIPRLVCWAVMDSNFDEEIPDDWCPFPIARELSLGEAKQYLENKVEGIVAQDLSTKDRVKIKTEYYIKLHQLLSNCTIKRAWELLKNGQDLATLEIPDELYPKMKGYRDALLTQFNTRLEHYQNIYDSTKDLSDKDFASSKYSNSEKSAVFAIRRNKLGAKSISSLIWQELKPCDTME